MTQILSDISQLDLSQYVRPGDHIVWGQACGEPQALIGALIEQVEFIGAVSAFAATSFSKRLSPEISEKLQLNSMGAIGTLRSLTAAGRLGVIPCNVSQIAPMIDQGLIGCDVAMVQVSPADENGMHSFGITNDFVHTAVSKARVVIAEINDQIPFTLGDTHLPADKIDVAVNVSYTPVEVPAAPISDTDQAIAKAVSAYIEDGACLQVGIGGVPDAIMRLVADRKELGVHSGMIGDSVVDLVEAGAVTNSRKPINNGVSVSGVLIGTKRLYEFADRNPLIELYTSAYTHNEAVLSSIPNLITVNSALEVDLTGQVNAEQSGSRYVGGTGGQVDYVRAGVRSPGGRSIIALPATAKGGSISRIATRLSGPVTTARTDVDIIVTEFGAAELRGQTLSERAKRLINIAHPDFREGLERDAHDIFKRGF